jgi:hypothetical protein
MPEGLPLLSPEDEEKLKISELPFGGLLGNSVLLRVIQEIIADPYREFRPKMLRTLTSSSPPRIQIALDILTSLRFVENTSNDAQRPVYRANLESKRLMALTLLAYAINDDRDGTDCMNEAIKYYCDDILFMQFRSPNTTQVYNVSYTYNRVNLNIITPASAVEPLDVVDLTPNT